MAYTILTIDQRLAWTDPDTQNSIIDYMRSKGYEISPRSTEDLADCIAQFCMHEGESGLDGLMMYHPDRSLIMRTAKKMGADGSMQATNMHAVHGITQSPAPTTGNQMPAAHSHNNTPVIVGLLGVIVLGIIVIAKR